MVAPPRPRRQPLRHRFQHLPPRLRLKRVGSHPAHFRAHCLCIRCYLPASLRALQCLRQHHGAQCPRLTWSRCSLRRRCNQCRCSSRRCRASYLYNIYKVCIKRHHRHTHRSKLPRLDMRHLVMEAHLSVRPDLMPPFRRLVRRCRPSHRRCSSRVIARCSRCSRSYRRRCNQCRCYNNKKT